MQADVDQEDVSFYHNTIECGIFKEESKLQPSRSEKSENSTFWHLIGLNPGPFPINTTLIYCISNL